MKHPFEPTFDTEDVDALVDGLVQIAEFGGLTLHLSLPVQGNRAAVIPMKHSMSRTRNPWSGCVPKPLYVGTSRAGRVVTNHGSQTLNFFCNPIIAFSSYAISAACRAFVVSVALSFAIIPKFFINQASLGVSSKFSAIAVLSAPDQQTTTLPTIP